MFKWLKRLLGTELETPITTVETVAPTPAIAAVEPVTVAPVAAEPKLKKPRAKKAEPVATAEDKPKRTARATPAKNAKTAK